MTRTGKYIRGIGLCGAAMLCVQTPAVGERVFAQQQLAWDGPVVGGGLFIVPDHEGEQDLTLEEGFSVASGGTNIQETPAGEALTQMYEGKWLEAIRSIESLDGSDPRMITDASGISRPLSKLKPALLASMPEPGKVVFRRLNNPAAKTRLMHASEKVELDERAEAYEAIVRDYALCDASALAAERLGDIRFEQGRFSEAASLYSFTAEHPTGPPDQAMLMAKRLIATARAEAWQSFDGLVEYAAFRHGDSEVSLGGQQTTIQQLIADLSESRAAEPIDNTPFQKLALPGPGDVSLDFKLFEPNQREALRTSANQNNLGGLVDQLTAPAAASDGSALYTLANATVKRIDPVTGETMWQVGNPDEHHQALTQRAYQISRGYYQSLQVVGEHVLAVVPDNSEISRSSLLAIDQDTGKIRWTWNGQDRTSNRDSVVGEPLVYGDRLYFTSYSSNQDLTLQVIDVNTGRSIGSSLLGKVFTGPNMSTPGELSPRLTMGNAHLLIQTNNGSLIAVEPDSRQVAWAFSEPIRQSALAELNRGRGASSDSLAKHTGDVFAKRGIVVTKGTLGNIVHAFHEHNAALLWSAQTDDDATVVHIDDRHAYVLDEQLTAYDLKTGERVWWTPHAGKYSGDPVFTNDACLLAGDRRLCRIDLYTGKVTDYDESLFERADLSVVAGGLLHLTYDRVRLFRFDDKKKPD